VSTEREELEARIRKAKADRAELEQQRDEREQLEELRRQAQREELLTRDAPHVAKAEEDHGPIGVKIAVLETDLGAIIVKRPNHLHYRRYQNKGASSVEDLWALVRPCLVYPSAAEVEKILEELPGKLLPLANRVVELAGHREEELTKK
jgi:hypothetical protein